MNQRNPGVELSKRNQSETALWREEMLATQWLSGRNSAPDCFTSVELRLGPGQSGNRGHLDPNQGAACMSIAKWTLALEIPEFLELLKLGMVFQPQRIFQPQNEQPELCQSCNSNFYLSPRWLLHTLYEFKHGQVPDQLSGSRWEWLVFVPWGFKLIRNHKRQRL